MRTHVSGAQSGTAPVCTSQSPAPVGTLWRLAKAAATAGQLSASQEGSRASPGGPRAHGKEEEAGCGRAACGAQGLFGGNRASVSGQARASPVGLLLCISR